MSDSPYSGLPPSRFWKTAVAERHPADSQDLYQPKFRIDPEWPIAAAGSCFAQHVVRELKARDYPVLDVEPAPPGLSEENARQYGFGLFSARFGNIYLVRQLLQLAREALEGGAPAETVWERDGRYFDALRPSVEPGGFATPDEVVRNRGSHLGRVKEMFARARLFVFTLGLTEGWQHTASGTVFPVAPGTMAGRHDPAKYSFVNFTCEEITRDFLELRSMWRAISPDIRFLLTVSPVPLTATASPSHVLVATTYSKAVLRAAAGELAAGHEDIDYFPSYEIIASPWARGFFFEPNLRSVSRLGVQTVMDVFFAAHGRGPVKAKPAGARRAEAADEDAICEEALLEAFAP